MKVKPLFMQNQHGRGALMLLTLFVLAALSFSACQTGPSTNGSSATANTSNNSNASTASTGYIDLVGKWEGQSQGQPSTLVITSHMGDTFTGTKTVGENQVSIAGIVDLNTRQITIRETNVVKGSGYAMGAGSGTIAPSGRQMTGEWKSKGGASQFSYSK
jgi:hypothetical protein